MKKNAIITIDYTTACVTKAFQKQARIFGTEEYKAWKAYRQDFPKAQENPYRAVLAWFLEQFPNYDDYKKFFEDKDKTAAAPAEGSTAAEEEAPAENVEFDKAS